MPNSFLSDVLVGRKCPDKAGRGVFARRDVAVGTTLAVWGGTVVTAAGLRRRRAEVRRLTLQVDEDAYLISDREGPADWVNHSCEPNAGLRGQITLVAMRPIARGAEVCFDYAMSDGSNYDNFLCRCKSPVCRGWVSGDDWMIPELQARYGNHFSPYLRDRIRRLAEYPETKFAEVKVCL
jgi:hypothetical protein